MHSKFKYEDKKVQYSYLYEQNKKLNIRKQIMNILNNNLNKY